MPIVTVLECLPLSVSLLSPSRCLVYSISREDANDFLLARTPNIDTMAANEHSSGIRIFDHSLSHAILQILFVRCILNDGQFKGVEIG